MLTFENFCKCRWTLVKLCTNVHTYQWFRVAKTHRMPYLYRSFSAQEPYDEWLFCEK